MHPTFRSKEFRLFALEQLQKRPDLVASQQAYLETSPQFATVDSSGFANFLSQNLRMTTQNRVLIYNIQEACKITSADAGPKRGLYNIHTLLSAIEFVQTSQGVIAGIFDKMYTKLKSGLPNLFETCAREDPGSMGYISAKKFYNFFDRDTRIPLKPHEKDAIDSFYDTPDGEGIDYADMKADFIKYLEKRNIRLEDVNGKAMEHLRKSFYQTFIAYLKQRQIIDPLKFFNADLKAGPDNNMMARYTFQNALSRAVPDMTDDQYKAVEEQLIPEKQQYVSLNEFVKILQEHKEKLSNADLEQISSLKQPYDAEKILCFYKICDAFERDEKNLRRELLGSNTGYSEFLDIIEPEKFFDFLRANKVDVEDLTRERLDHAFQTKNETKYNLKELLSYFQLKTTGRNKSIFERSQDLTRGVVKDLVEHLITSKKLLIQPIMSQDMDHDGLMLETEFYMAAQYQTINFDQDSRKPMKFRYDEFKDDRLNILSLFYDMELVRRKAEPPLEPFSELPFKNVMKVNELMVRFCSRMKEIGLTSENLVGQLIQLGQSPRIKISLVLLKIVEIMEPVIYSKTSYSGVESKSAIQWVIEIAQCLDEAEEGTIMDFELVSKLNSFLNIEMRSVLENLLRCLEAKRFDLRAFLSAAISTNDLINISKLKDTLLKEKFQPPEIETFLKKLGLIKVEDISLIKLARKIETEMTLMGIGGSPKNVKRVIYGAGRDGQTTEVDERVDLILTLINDALTKQGKNFNGVFQYPENKTITRLKMEAIITKELNIREYGQYNYLTSMIQEKSDPALLNLQKFKEIFEAKFANGGVNSSQANEALDVTIKNLKKQLESVGANISLLFNTANSNNDDGIDRREFFYFLYMVDNSIRKTESNMIFDRIDRDKTGTISRSEFDNFFALDPSLRGSNKRIDELKWAVHIFQELNLRLHSEW